MANVKMFKLPNISRSITDKFLFSKVVTIFLFSIFLIAIIIVGFDLLKGIYGEIRLTEERRETEIQINYWKNILDKQSNYRDGYIELAILEYRLGDKGKAVTYLQDALNTDPNFGKSRELENLLR